MGKTDQWKSLLDVVYLSIMSPIIVIDVVMIKLVNNFADVNIIN